MSPRRRELRGPSRRARRLLAVGAWALGGLLAGVAVAAPSWWTSRGVLTTNAPSDYAAVNVGQAMQIARKAYDEIQAGLPGGAGPTLSNLVFGFAPTNAYTSVAVGQLKALAAPFYDRLIAANFATGYPWSATTSDDADRAMANIGQLKRLFSFDFADGDGDGMPDWWEAQFGLSDPLADPDGDGLTNLAEYTRQTNPLAADTDGDGFADGLEAAEDSSPRSAGSRPSVAILEVYNTRER